MNKCRKCNSTIDSKKGNYCDSCWNEAKIEYQIKLNIYNNEIVEWNSLSDREKTMKHIAAEHNSLFKYSFGFFCVILLIEFIYGYKIKLANSYQFIILYVLTFIAGMILSYYYSKIIGRIVRGFTKTLIIGLIFFVVGFFIIGHFFPSYGLLIAITLAIIGVIIGIFTEISGYNHASGAPKCPTEPSRY
jgi:hypothetical protein